MDWQSMPREEQEWHEPARYLDARYDPRVEPPLPAFLRSPRASSVNHDLIGADLPSTGWRIVRTLSWFVVPVLVGISAGLAWQTHGAAARDMIGGQIHSLGGLLTPTKSPPAVAVPAPDMMQLLEPLAYKFEVVRRNVEQLAARQEQMAQSIVLLQAVADDIREKMSSPSSSPTQQETVDNPQHQAPQPRAPSSAVQTSSVPRSPPAAGPSLSLH
jgi:hypothetical protein